MKKSVCMDGYIGHMVKKMLTGDRLLIRARRLRKECNDNCISFLFCIINFFN